MLLSAGSFGDTSKCAPGKDKIKRYLLVGEDFLKLFPNLILPDLT
jgi:hypothetical protein